MSKEKLPYSVGTIKLTWINPSNYKVLESEMFKSVQDALKNLPKSKGNNWLVFELIETDGKKYKWKVLPYGKHRGYVNSMKLRDNPLIKFSVIGLLILGGLSFYNGMIEE